MLDLLANNDWEHPIYFTGGANADEEYIWLKDYLQLDGLSYKFVPIKKENKGNMFDMGRIDSESMYRKIKSWDWDEVDPYNTYIDVESRKNSISFRNNMMRLTETFIEEGDLERAEEILDMSLTEMPIDVFGHYGISLGYPELYYKMGNTEKARATSQKLIGIFQEKLIYYSRFDDRYLELIFNEIERNINMYRSVLADIDNFEKEDKDYTKACQEAFFEHIKLYQHLMQ